MVSKPNALHILKTFIVKTACLTGQFFAMVSKVLKRGGGEESIMFCASNMFCAATTETIIHRSQWEIAEDSDLSE